MIINGVDTSVLGDQFEGYVPGRTLILDGDGPAYVASATSKTLPTAIKRMQQAILTHIFSTGSERAIVHLTAQSSHKAGRFNVVAAKPYQGNRDGKAKPPLLESTRQAIANPDNWLPQFEVIMHYTLEADDGMMMDAYRLKDDGVIWSEDKDLRMTPYPYWERKVGRIVVPGMYGYLYPDSTPGGTLKTLGYGRAFFWAQMLMGDTADNIAGVLKFDGKQCGPVGAYAALADAKSEDEAANIVISAYRAINQNPIPEGWLLWLLRHHGDTFWQYLQEVRLSEANRAFVNECVQREWFLKPAVKEELEF